MLDDKPIDLNKLFLALRMLNDQLILADSPQVRMIVCGGSALIATGLVSRTTRINGPAMQFRMGLPEGFQSRLQCVEIGKKLIVYFIGRLDQIHFKVYASADRGGYHVSDLRKLNPTEEELVQAAGWSMTQDTSEGFRCVLKDMFKQLGWSNVAARI